MSIWRIARGFLFLSLLIFSDSQPAVWPLVPEFCSELAKGSPELAKQDYDDCREVRCFWKIFVPDRLGKIISSHVEMMHQQGYFENLSEKDFDHGHFILRQGADFFYYSLDEFFKNVVMILYHTQEHTQLWRNQARAGIPFERRTPRSILGFLNGMIRPAVEFADMNFSQRSGYELAGTIDSYNVRSTLGLFDRECDVCVAIEWRWFKPEGSFMIRPHPYGRYQVGKARYDIFMRYLPYRPKPAETAKR